MNSGDDEELFTAEKPPVEDDNVGNTPPAEPAPIEGLVSAPTPPAPVVEQTYTVLPGEKLIDIAKKLNTAGGWPALFHKNRELIGDNPNHVAAGTTLVLP